MLSLFLLVSLTISLVESNEELNRFNEIFLSTYRQTRENLLKTLDPMIIATGMDVKLIHRGETKFFDSLPEFYHNLKTISHVPLTIYLKLFENSSIDRSLSTIELNSLKSYLREIRRIRKSIKSSDFLSNENIFQIQLKILDLSIKYLRPMIQSKTFRNDDLKEFCRQSKKVFSENFPLAARTHLDEMHSKIYPWYIQTLNQTERQSVQVLIIGPKSAREGFLTQQYFVKLLNEPLVEGKRLLFVENLSDLPSALNVFGSWTLDRHAAKAFFDDETTLHRDLLQNYASIYIEKLFES